jgi:formylglycine-generating enzyme required for sulfatase activity
VTVGQFRKFTEASSYKTEAERDGTGGWGYNPEIGTCEGRRPQFNWHNPGFPQTDDHPVLNVTWNDAVAFCQWLSRQEGKTYRLPTEAEWEYACRAGTDTRYNFGDDPTGLAKAAKTTHSGGRACFPAVQNLKIPKDASNPFTAPVGSFRPNRWGLYDMHGNAWEWCADWYGEDYYSKSPVDDPKGPATGIRRVRRGGAWNTFPIWARASFRNWNTPVSRCVNLGFRTARDE